MQLEYGPVRGAELEDDRKLMERALEVSSQELLEANSEMRAVFQAIPDLEFG